MVVERSEFHRKVEFQVCVNLADGNKHTLNETIFLEGTYEDLYSFHISWEYCGNINDCEK